MAIPNNGDFLASGVSWDQLKRLASTEQAEDNVLLIRKFGRSAVLSANVTQDVWETGGIKAIPTAAEIMNIASSDAADTAAGTGAQMVQVSGLAADYSLQSEFVSMNGTSNVATVNEYLFVNRCRVVLSGSGQKNAGNITVTGATSTNTFATIAVGESITQQSHFTVPLGYTAFTTSVVLSAYRSSGSGSRAVEADTMAYSPDANTIFQTLRYGVSSSSAFYSTPPCPSQTSEKTTLWFQATAESNNTVVTSVQEILLLKGNFNINSEI